MKCTRRKSGIRSCYPSTCAHIIERKKTPWKYEYIFFKTRVMAFRAILLHVRPILIACSRMYTHLPPLPVDMGAPRPLQPPRVPVPQPPHEPPRDAASAQDALQSDGGCRPLPAHHQAHRDAAPPRLEPLGSELSALQGLPTLHLNVKKKAIWEDYESF